MISGYPHFWKNSFDSFTWRIRCIPPCLLSDVSKKCWSEDPGAHQMISGCSFGPVGSECNRSMNSSVFSVVMLGITGKHEWKRYFLLLKIFLKKSDSSKVSSPNFISFLVFLRLLWNDFQVTGPTTPIHTPGRAVAMKPRDEIETAQWLAQDYWRQFWKKDEGWWRSYSMFMNEFCYFCVVGSSIWL